jgi:hypothetical protein
MANIKIYNFSGIDFRISGSDYFDFYLNANGMTTVINDVNVDFSYQDWGFDWDITEETPSDYLTVSFDFNFSNPNNQIISTLSGGWGGSTTSSFTATTYGLTGLDNGAITYSPELDTYGHDALLSALTGTTLVHVSGDTQLKLNKVTGYTGNYIYPIELISTTASTGNYANFCGGFYQGYYKLDGYDYELLPNRYESGWTIETWLNQTVTGDTCGNITGTTLNDTYPNNKGFFYYIGTRAENKFWNIFTGNTTGCTSGSTDFCMDIKEIDININNIIVDGSGTTLSVPLSPPPIDIKRIKNQFLIFGRSNGLVCENKQSKDGYGQVRANKGYDKNLPRYSTIVREETTNFTNPFLIFGRSNGLVCDNVQSDDGYGQERVGSFSGLTAPIIELDKDSDLIDNAIGFRIKDDGSIGYRLLTISGDCKSVEMVEEYSASGTVTSDKWEHIVVKWVNSDNYSKCDLIHGAPRKGKLKFYINSMLRWSSSEIDEMIFKRLDDFQEKQVGVPYNISIGGGTQGLLESMTFDGQDVDDLGLIIERNFAGTFIGSISKFNMYNKNLSWCQIKDTYKINVKKYV